MTTEQAEPGTLAAQETDQPFVLPMSSGQQRLWFLAQLDPGSAAAYLGYGAAHLRGTLDRGALQSAVDALVERHETLRTSFGVHDGEPVQFVHDAGPHCRLLVRERDVTAAADPGASLNEALAQETSTPFAVDEAPLARVTLIKLAADDHVLVVTFHHGIGDMWSGAVFVRELAACYEAFLTGGRPDLPQLPVQYGDYAEWQRRRFDSGELLGQLAWWRMTLEDLPALDLATDRQRPATQSFRGATRVAHIPPDVVADLQRLAGEHRASLFMVLHAAYCLLLSRYSGQDDIPVGTSVAGRDRPELENLIGMFINTLVLRTDLGGDPTFGELVDRCREVCLGAYAHADVPFEQLVQELRPERDLSRAPLAQAILMLGNTPPDELRLPGLTVEPVPVDPGTAKVDLFLALVPDGDGLRAELEYDTALFDSATADRMLDHFCMLLRDAPAAAGERLSSLRPLPEGELEQLRQWGTGETDAPLRELPVHRMVEEQAARLGGKCAVFLDEQALTYDELNERANRLAHLLRRRGVAPGVRVGVCTERTPDLVVALLAVLKSGGAYVPIDPEYPAERVRYLLQDSGISLLLSHRTLAGRLPRHDTGTLHLDDDPWPAAGEPSTNPEPLAGPEDLAYVIYTSGSTGRPKGVMIPHGRLPNLLDSMRNEPGLDEGDTVAATITHAFDMSVIDLFLPLTTGATVALFPRADVIDGERLAARMTATKATYWQATPAAWQLLLETGWQAEHPFRGLCGAEPLTPEMTARMAAAGVEAWQVYGPTETTVWASCHRAREGESPVPLGRPLPHTRFRVLDGDGRPVPVSVTGELYIGGPGVALGYHGRPELTAHHFVPEPGNPGALMYRTGDLVRYRSDGRLEFVGRADSQVKIRGFRVEPGEVAAVLREHEAVSESVVVLREDTPGDRRLTGYVVPGTTTGDPGGLVGDLREWALARLPEYMVPASLAVLEAMPRTPNGKVDKAALPVPDGAARASADEFTAPRTGTEEYIAGLWKEVLGVERVGADDDFFVLGGHSLLAGRVVGRLSKRFGRRIPVRLLFDRPTVASLAQELDGSGEEQAAAPAPEAQETGRETPDQASPPAPDGADAPAGTGAPAPDGEAKQREQAPRPGPDGPAPLPRLAAPGEDAVLLPASLGQSRLWFLHELDPGSTRAYLMPAQVELDGPVDEPALTDALGRLAERHETLRTALVERDGELRQAVHPQVTVPLERIDLRGAGDGERDRETERILREAATRPFDLARAPLMRATLLRTGEERRVLSLVFHHAVCDRWSVSVLVRELVTLYESRLAGADPALPELPVQYGDYADWQRKHLTAPETERQLAYWKETLADLMPVELPADHPRPPVQTFRGGVRYRPVPAAVMRTLEHLGARSGATLFMVLLAAFDVLIQHYSGRQDVAVGSPVAGRGRPESENLIGFFVNNLVLRTDLSGDPAFTELLARVRETCLGAYAHPDVPFERLVDEVGAARDLSRTPLFQTVFSFGNVEVPQVRMGDADVRPFDIHSGTSKFDLVLEIVPRGDGWRAAMEYNTDLFEPATVDRMFDHYLELLQAVAQTPEAPLSGLPGLPASDREHLRSWSRGEVRPIPGVPAHVLFEEQAAARPGAAALSSGTTTVTYGQLNARANRLARRLRALGVGPGTLVALLTGRSVETYTGILAVLKAGGAYVPVDPGYPPERIRFMLADCAAPVVLTRSGLLDRLGDRPGGEQPATTVLVDEEPVEAEEREEGAQEAEEREAEERDDEQNPTPLAGPDDLAYVIYTSGSTGRPKGTMISHRSVADLHLTRDLIGVGPGDRMLAFASTSFDASVWEWVMALLGGACLVVPDDGATLAGEDLAAEVRSGAATVALFPPSLLALLDPGELPSLRTVVSGGEDCPAAVAARWAPHVRLLNAYGPTEITVYATLAGPLAGDRHPPIGRPVPNAGLQVLGQDGRPVPVGVPGELHVGGPGVAHGYLGRPELTAERFPPDPDRPGGRLYRTGDLVRWLPGGELEYLGREDDQVKIRGFRIELGEIEAVLRTHPAVRDAVAVAREDVPGDPRLTAYVSTGPGSGGGTGTGGAQGEENEEAQEAQEGVGSADPADAELIAELYELARGRLPEYMVPAHVAVLREFPRTPSGKTDRAALPAPGTVRTAAARSGHVTPSTPAEAHIAQLFAQVLGVEEAGAHDDFFELGGNSLSATRLHAAVRDAWPDAAPPLRLLFERPTPHALARAVAGDEAGHESPDPADDVVLDPAIRVEGTWEWNPDPRAVLLTGATGFLGAFLLDALLRSTRAEIVCLVRAKTPEAAREKLVGHLRGLKLWDRWDEATRDRMRALPGDLAEPHLGLGQDGFRELAHHVEEIHHSGAAVNFAKPYAALRSTNVGGTQQILRLACTGPVKPVHHVSTLSVFTLRREGDPPAREDELPEHAPPAENGYNQSKWAAEQIVALARERGVPVSVYRPGRIAGDSTTGVWRADDVFTHILRACALVGSVPALDFSTDIVPVDHIAHVVAQAARGREHLGRTYQFGGTERLRFDGVHRALRLAGHPVRRDAFEDWYEACRDYADRHPGSELGPTLSLFGKRVEDDRSGLREPVFDTANTLRVTGGRRPPAVDDALLGSYLRELTAIGFLPPPPPAAPPSARPPGPPSAGRADGA
ncbi:non-ribosomal peptide synthetase [Streptomyces sp. WMMB 322]|uniref:non-ribosomal peptide synthetase n=1 Tax=Streptomyces sp. WMMB 322 TaxID=1286821 RepID=UPI0006E140C5|nr:non-ribosomal peptide synthetase [Streptomyces sp. WMMB 322]SCK55851.1 amino acid adenylation domain-containing protein/thioester reductase domain-containing protein [Streptomyces sp. WMMB 322]